MFDEDDVPNVYWEVENTARWLPPTPPSLLQLNPANMKWFAERKVILHLGWLPSWLLLPHRVAVMLWKANDHQLEQSACQAGTRSCIKKKPATKVDCSWWKASIMWVKRSKRTGMWNLILYAPDLLTSNFARDLISRHCFHGLSLFPLSDGIIGWKRKTRRESLRSFTKSKRNSLTLKSPQDCASHWSLRKTRATWGRSSARWMPSVRMRLFSARWRRGACIIQQLSAPAWGRYFGSRSSNLRLMNLFSGREKVAINSSARLPMAMWIIKPLSKYSLDLGVGK